MAKKAVKRKPKQKAQPKKPARKSIWNAKRVSRPPKRLYRSGNERVLGGVCGGVAEYYKLDPTVIRILFILLTLVYGLGIVLYVALWLVMPRNPSHDWGTGKKAKRK